MRTAEQPTRWTCGCEWCQQQRYQTLDNRRRYRPRILSAWDRAELLVLAAYYGDE